MTLFVFFNLFLLFLLSKYFLLFVIGVNKEKEEETFYQKKQKNEKLLYEKVNEIIFFLVCGFHNSDFLYHKKKKKINFVKEKGKR